MPLPGRSRSRSNYIIPWQGMLYHAIVTKNEVIDDNTRCGVPLQARMSVTLLQSTWSFIIFAAFQPFFFWHEYFTHRWPYQRILAPFPISFIRQSTAVSESRWISANLPRFSLKNIISGEVSIVRFVDERSRLVIRLQKNTRCFRFIHKICFLAVRKVGQRGTRK